MVCTVDGEVKAFRIYRYDTQILALKVCGLQAGDDENRRKSKRSRKPVNRFTASPSRQPSKRAEAEAGGAAPRPYVSPERP